MRSEIKFEERFVWEFVIIFVKHIFGDNWSQQVRSCVVVISICTNKLTTVNRVIKNSFPGF